MISTSLKPGDEVKFSSGDANPGNQNLNQKLLACCDFIIVFYANCKPYPWPQNNKSVPVWCICHAAKVWCVNVMACNAIDENSCTSQHIFRVPCVSQCNLGIGDAFSLSCKCGSCREHANQIINKFFQAAFCAEVKRVGEAENPGPFAIATFNPTQLLGREEEVATFADGIWTACETSHTCEAQGVINNRFRALQVNSMFSKAAEKHSDNKGIFRGKAVGAAVLSRFPLQPYPEALDPDANATCRFADAIVRLKPNLPLYTCAIYGPPENNTILADAEKVFVAASRPGVERASAFKGPAAITGDLNRELHEVPFWPLLQRKGWVDCAMLCHQRFGTPLSATCRDRSRKSFILVNPILAQFLTACDTVHEHLFDSHPVLQATFDVDASVMYRQVWSLPRSLDDLQFDGKK